MALEARQNARSELGQERKRGVTQLLGMCWGSAAGVIGLVLVGQVGVHVFTVHAYVFIFVRSPSSRGQRVVGVVRLQRRPRSCCFPLQQLPQNARAFRFVQQHPRAAAAAPAARPVVFTSPLSKTIPQNHPQHRLLAFGQKPAALSFHSAQQFFLEGDGRAGSSWNHFLEVVHYVPKPIQILVAVLLRRTRTTTRTCLAEHVAVAKPVL
mmetsp:Transcript_17328/g.43097  ORF Transcript_17328/g.43097 Transcript_17328/m.43097 type:complete len:209 (-) Transcript_17328:2752-3378(-)